MTITREDLNPCTVKLSVVCAPEQVKEGFDKAYKQIAKQVKVPGFRPGHAPRAMIEQLVPKEEVLNEAADQIVRRVYRKAVEQEGLEPDPGQRPNVDLTKLDADESTCEFTVLVPLPPVVEIGDYKGLPVEEMPITVTDEEVDFQIEELRKRRGTREAVTDRGVQEGDVAVVNLKPDGEEGDGRNFMVIAGKTFAELDAALLGMNVDDIKSVELTFPDSFHEKDWAGKSLTCRVMVNSVNTIQLPELDDEFARDLKTENVQDLRERMKAMIERAKQQMSMEMMSEQAFEALLGRSKIEVSDNSWENLAARRLYDIDQDQRRQGKTLEQFAQANGLTLEGFAEAQRAEAKKHIQRALLIREIFSKENMTLTNQELNVELFTMAEEYQVPAEQMLKTLQENKAVDELHFRAISRKVSTFLVDNAAKTAAAGAGA